MNSYTHEPLSRCFAEIEATLEDIDLSGHLRNYVRSAVYMHVSRLASELTTQGNGLTPIQFARQAQQTRLRSREILGADLIRDTNWEILLELYIAAHERRRVSVSSVCHITNAPVSTALRHLIRLTELGFVAREDDPEDSRRSWVNATPKAITSVDRLIARMLTSDRNARGTGDHHALVRAA